jgi:hypothetical protein
MSDAKLLGHALAFLPFHSFSDAEIGFCIITRTTQTINISCYADPFGSVTIGPTCVLRRRGGENYKPLERLKKSFSENGLNRAKRLNGWNGLNCLFRPATILA